MTFKLKLSAFMIAVLCLLPSAGLASDAAVDAARALPIQHNGRVKSFEAFSRQTMTALSSRERWQKRTAVEVMLDAYLHRADVYSWKWIRVDNAELIKAAGLDPAEHFFSHEQVEAGIDTVKALVRSSQAKRDRDERPTLLEQKAEQLYTKFFLVEHIASGEIFTMVPHAGHAAWTSPGGKEPLDRELRELLALYEKRDAAGFKSALRAWSDKASAVSGDPSVAKIPLENLYYRTRPFEAAAALYFLAFLLISFIKKNTVAQRAGIALFIAAALAHTAGLALRVIILARPPVSNMYESMVFMNWALVVFALVFALARRNALVLSAAAVISGFVMIYANILPIDASLEVLVPVLRSNYWLTIHVMTIVASYGAFGLALALGHRQLFLEKRGKLTKKASDESASLIYRVIQLGTLLVGAGTVLGGVWANESWGRFWGWDPKETWALITFLGYLVVVHLRHVGKLSDKAVAISSVVGFLLVLMTWYGVNFVLGRGLHSYGAGSGGMEWVIYFLVFEAVFMAWALTAKPGRKN